MRSRFSGLKASALRAAIAAVLFCGVALTVGLSAAPQLHHWLHKSEGGNHECAATQLSSSSWEHSACDPVLTAPQPAPVSPSFVRPGLRVIAQVSSSILEHAPPARS
ncbi:MAG: hypothetical protein H0X73_02375 [Chthoniobacterales bacterium]|nr:hypothetical protein [Chthoniobacterales bacterium]